MGIWDWLGNKRQEPTLGDPRAETREVNNRTFLLGLDGLYRDAMKRHERGELLDCARCVAAAYGVAPANDPVEGYYAEEPALTEYFRLLRGLSRRADGPAPNAASRDALARLRQVVGSRLYGTGSADDTTLVRQRRSCMSRALLATRPDWTLRRILEASHRAALEDDDFSLVGLAARAKDIVCLAATRESVVLYEERLGTGLPQRPTYRWTVEDGVASNAQRFIDLFNELLGEHLPSAVPDNAEAYWAASKANEIRGRCVAVGYESERLANKYYHMGIVEGPTGELEVRDFWESEIWTTERFRRSRPPSWGGGSYGGHVFRSGL